MIEGIRTARKTHQCFDCYRPIYAGESYKFTVCIHNGAAYTLKQHFDCRDAAVFYRKAAGLHFRDFEDGYPPLADMIDNCGEFEADMALLRGRFPHVVCRMEFTQQIAEINYQKRRA